jgi:putative membrane protein
MWYGHGMDWGSGWTWAGGIGMILFWAVIIGLVVWGIRRAMHHGHFTGMSGGKTPLDIARERYAKGEITLAQFEEIKKNL